MDFGEFGGDFMDAGRIHAEALACRQRLAR
jgi:hypothetical protein